MILVRNLRLEPGEALEKLRQKAARKLRVQISDIADIRPVKRSLDARKKNDIHYTCSAAVTLKRGEERALKIAGKSEDAPSVTENELKYIVESIEEEGVLEESESEMVRSALDFDETTAEEILTPRVDVVFLNIEDSQQKIKDIIIENRYSRIPVYEDTVDNIVGILHTRDYLECLADGKAPELKDIMQPPFFVFKSQQLSKILSNFKRTRNHIAIVTDEYGGTLGIVTMEDLLEEIVGDIWDEDEEIEHSYYKIGKDEFLVNGDIELDDMLALFNIDEGALESDSITVGGFILEHAGNIPKKRESIESDGFRFTVMEVENQRIMRVVVKKLEDTAQEEEDTKQ